MTKTYYFLLASERFLTEEEPLAEVLEERTRHYLAQNKPIDFWLVCRPQFLEASALANLRRQCPHPAAAIISTDPQFIIWLKHRLQYVLTGTFEAPTAAIPDPLAAQKK